MKKMTNILMTAGCSLALTLTAGAQERGGNNRGGRGGHHGMGGMMAGMDMGEVERAMKALREKADADGDGKLNAGERKVFFASMRDARRMKQKEYMTKWDKDGDGTLRDEERAAMQKGQAEDEFSKLDADKNGSISRAEFLASKEKQHKAMTGIRDMFRGNRNGRRGKGDGGKGSIERFDENGDGIVDDAEKRKAAEAILKRMEAKGLSGEWKSFDKDADGILNGDERESLLKDLFDRLGQKGKTDAKGPQKVKKTQAGK